MNSARFPKHTVWIALALLLVTAALYWPVTRYDFVDYDDHMFVTKNPRVQQGFTQDNFRWAFTTIEAYIWHPVTWFSHMADCQWFGPDKPGMHHLTNLVFHTVNTILLFLVLLRLTKVLWPSAAVAALFAWHPLHVQSVAWIAERKDVLSCFFWILCLWAYLRYVERPGLGRYLVLLILFALGLMSKSMVVTLPCVLLLIDYWPLARWLQSKPNGEPAGTAPPTRRMIVEKLPLFALSLASSIVTVWAQKRGGAMMTVESMPYLERVLNALAAYGEYLLKTVWPAGLAVYYPKPDSTPWAPVAGALVVLLLVSWTAITWRKSRPWFLVGWLWFLGTLVPVIGLVQVGSQALADRYTYIPLTGIFIMAAWGVAELCARSLRWRAGLLAAGSLALVGFTVRTRQEITHWRNTTALFEHALRVTKGNHVAHKTLADALIEERKFDEGIHHYHEALKAAPKFAEVYNNLGVAYFKAGQFTNAIEPFRRAVEYKPTYAAAHKNLGNALVMAGRPAEAIPSYETALRLQPGFTEARNYLGLALFKLKRYDEAIPNYLEALRQEPALNGARYDLGLIYFRQSKFSEAAEQFTAILKSNPGDANAHFQLGLVLITQHKTGEALPHLRESVRLRPDSLQTMNALAWVLATHDDEKLRNGAEAVRLAERAVQLSTPPGVPQLNTLAAALAEAGQFTQAVATTEKALELAKSTGQKDMAAQLQERLALYQKGKPFRDAGLSPPKPKVTVTPLTEKPK